MPNITRFRFIAVIAIAAALAIWAVHATRSHRDRGPLLARADELSWNNRWLEATPLYAEAERAYAKDDPRKALCAHVSQFVVRADSEPAGPLLLELTHDLDFPAAQDSETRLCILIVKGMIETNYDAAMARSTWKTIQGMARDDHRYLLMARAIGEQGIAAFLLGDFSAAKKQVLRAWLAAKYLGDDAAHVRYASLYGAGLVELHRYPDALRALDEAINTANKSKNVAYPSIAINSKIDALRGLHRYQEALVLADQAIRQLPADHLDAHLYQILTSKGSVYEDRADWDAAIPQYAIALGYARRLRYSRGIVQTGGLQARAYLHQHRLREALESINEALRANEAIPQELYFSPRNLATKAQILDAMGKSKQSQVLHQESLNLLDSLLLTTPTPNVERELLTEMRFLYSDYFGDLCQERRYSEAFAIIEKARGRIETSALMRHTPATLRSPTEREEQLTELDISLIKSEDPSIGTELERAVMESTPPDTQSTLNYRVALHPVGLKEIQAHLGPSELLLEYVLDEPSSSVLAITRESVTRYILTSGKDLESEALEYRKELHSKKTDTALSAKLFTELLGLITQYREKTDVIIVPDDQLHLLPFASLVEDGRYALESHSFSVVPSASVLALLRDRAESHVRTPRTFAGIAASSPGKSRGAESAGLLEQQFHDVPETEAEVRSIATNFRSGTTILVGREATETHFKSLPLQDYEVLHLAVHGYANTEGSDRTALLFSPEVDGKNDGVLSLSEIQAMHLRAGLVTLSACDTGVGPVSEVDVDNLANAFIEAGAESVVAALWELDDLTTARMMKAFYKALSERQTKVQALRSAQLEIMRANLPPYYWASVELLGDPSGTL